MKLVIDASVFLAFAIPEEKEHAVAAEFFAHCETESHQLIFPALAIAEVAAGVARRKRDPQKAALAVQRMQRLASVRFAPLSRQEAEAAAKLAALYFLRGADAVYCQLARESKAPLITLDLEILDRIAGHIVARSPQNWLDSRNA